MQETSAFISDPEVRLWLSAGGVLLLPVLLLLSMVLMNRRV